jgi:hypothetical protein
MEFNYAPIIGFFVWIVIATVLCEASLFMYTKFNKELKLGTKKRDLSKTRRLARIFVLVSGVSFLITIYALAPVTWNEEHTKLGSDDPIYSDTERKDMEGTLSAEDREILEASMNAEHKRQEEAEAKHADAYNDFIKNARRSHEKNETE